MAQKQVSGPPFWVFFLCLCGLLVALFAPCLKPVVVCFSNDGPLGANSQQSIQRPAAYWGVWYDLNSIGNSGGTSMPNLSTAIFWLLGPVYWAKFFPSLVILFVGCCG